MRLRELTAPGGEETTQQTLKMREDQQKLYKKWRFYDEIIKANEKCVQEKNRQN